MGQLDPKLVADKLKIEMKMSLTIIGAGFGRTGTLSTQFALNELGFPCYHMKEVMKKVNKNHLDFWVEVSKAPKGSQHNWNEVFSNYSATVDYPSSCVWQELAEAYPNAKIILTLHPKGPEAWYKSTIDTIYALEIMWESKVFSFIIPVMKKMSNMISNLIWNRFLKGTMDNKEEAIKRYNEHIEEVKSHIPPDRLLIFSVDQGWKPLCEFLGKEVPKIDFPNVNDKAEMKKQIRLMSLFAKFLIALVTIIVIAFIWMVLFA